MFHYCSKMMEMKGKQYDWEKIEDSFNNNDFLFIYEACRKYKISKSVLVGAISSERLPAFCKSEDESFYFVRPKELVNAICEGESDAAFRPILLEWGSPRGIRSISKTKVRAIFVSAKNVKDLRPRPGDIVNSQGVTVFRVINKDFSKVEFNGQLLKLKSSAAKVMRYLHREWQLGRREFTAKAILGSVSAKSTIYGGKLAKFLKENLELKKMFISKPARKYTLNF